jgi:hypothetical protein
MFDLLVCPDSFFQTVLLYKEKDRLSQAVCCTVRLASLLEPERKRKEEKACRQAAEKKEPSVRLLPLKNLFVVRALYYLVLPTVMKEML